MAAFAVLVEGVANARDLITLRGDIEGVKVRAVNKIARDARVEAARRITRQVNLPKSYVAPSSGRLSIIQPATRFKSEAVIRAEGRATSLARFAVGSPKLNKAGVTVAVKPGQATFLRKAFLIKLPGIGGSTDAGKFNTGLAIRLAAGERISNKLRQVRLAKGLYLLYGPSVQQVFLDNQGKGVADDMAPDLAAKLENEIARLILLGRR